MGDLLPFLDTDITVQFLQRSRGLWSKTFGIAWQIHKAQGDLVHCNYALQNAWLTDKLSHLDILHCHGSDIRCALNSRRYGWIVRYSLCHAKKVLYATPDLADKVKQFRGDAVYLPTPVDTERFSLKEEYSSGKLKALYFKQSYEVVEDFSFEFKVIQKYFDVTIHERNVPYEQMPQFLKQFDLFIDRFSIPSFSKTCLEAMSCGLSTIDCRHNASLNSLRSVLEDDRSVQDVGWFNRMFVENNHNVKVVAKQLSQIYREEAIKNGVA